MKNLLKYCLFIVIALIMLPNTLSAQKLNHVLGDVLVKFNGGTSPAEFSRDLQSFNGKPTDLHLVKPVIQSMNIWLFHFDPNTIHERAFLKQIKTHPGVEVAQFNHITSLRATIPDDPLFPDQWQYINDGSGNCVEGADIDMELAWDTATGGLTPQGDTIVVCIIDSGLDANHEDFGDNRWYNYEEIPGNGIDDDNNGYTDDYAGWDTGSDSDNIGGGSHGTSVAGIIGAKGNNGIGVAGVNWDVKLMIVDGGTNVESEVLEAYGWPYTFRKRYNETDGAEGAFVVATNASWGQDFGQPEDAPLWCAFYDTLGVQGILNCGATINGNQNVDEVGDLPTACPSDFMISVTNMNCSDTKVGGAGYGATTIDLGAFGEGTYTTRSGNNYAGFGGTSGATPHVTGAIALLYSVPCSNLIQVAKADPELAARQVRQYILEGVDANESLAGITVTEGRLNVNNSIQLLLSNCGPCPSPVGLDAQVISLDETMLTWANNDSTLTNTLQWRAIGEEDWNTVMMASSPYMISGLSSCTTYEFQVDGICVDTTSGFSAIHTFNTEVFPSNLALGIVTESSASISWTSPSVISNGFSISLLNTNSATTTDYVLTPNDIANGTYTFDDLEACSEYQVMAISECATMNEAFAQLSFFTEGCGPCVDMNYCVSVGESTEDEWIESTVIAGVETISGNNDGYNIFRSTNIELFPNGIFDITLTQAYSGNSWPEYFKIWIDYNQDGEFDEDSELAYDPGQTVTEPVMLNITIPSDALLGQTRMRVTMKYLPASSVELPFACEEEFRFGEVEDYCITMIENPIPCVEPLNPIAMSIDTFAASLVWDEVDDAISYALRYKELEATDWIDENLETSSFDLSNLNVCTMYEFQVRTMCPNGVSNYTASHEFMTLCFEVSNKNIESILSYQVQPNPFNQSFSLNLQMDQSDTATIELFDMSGKRVFQKENQNLHVGENLIRINPTIDISSGIYFMQLTTSKGILNARVVKQ